MRSAGYKALLLLLQKQDERVDGAMSLPAIVSPWLQAYAAVYLSDSFTRSSLSSVAKSKKEGGGNRQGNADSMPSLEPKHHTFGLHGASPTSLKASLTHSSPHSLS